MVKHAATVMVIPLCQKTCGGTCGRPSAAPIKRVTRQVITVSAVDHTATTTYLLNTIAEREVGNASKSFTVRSEYSRPNTQLAMRPKRTMPPAPLAWSLLDKKGSRKSSDTHDLRAVLSRPSSTASAAMTAEHHRPLGQI